MIDLFTVPAVDFFLTEGVYNILRKGLFIHALLLSYLVIIKKTRDVNIGKQWRYHDNTKKLFVYELFCQLGKIFYLKKDNDNTRKIAPWKTVTRKLVPNPNTPSNPNPGEDIFWGSLPRANFLITDNSMLLLRIIIKKKAKENSVSRNCFINVFRKYRKNRTFLELSYTRRIR